MSGMSLISGAVRAFRSRRTLNRLDAELPPMIHDLRMLRIDNILAEMSGGVKLSQARALEGPFCKLQL